MKQRINKNLILFLISVAAIGLSGCGKSAVVKQEEPTPTTNPYTMIEYYNNKGQILKEQYYGDNPHVVEYSYDDTNNLLNAKITGSSIDRTLYKINCYYSNNLLANKIIYDDNGIIEENINYTYKNGVISKTDDTTYSQDKGKVVIITEYDSNGTVTKITGDDWYRIFEGNFEYYYELTEGEYVLSDTIEKIYDGDLLLKETYNEKNVVYNYNDSGQLERVLTYVPDDSSEDNLSIGVYYEYDENGNNTKKTTYRFFKTITEIEYVVEIRYDAYGNPLCQLTNDNIDFLVEYSYYDSGAIKEIRHYI